MLMTFAKDPAADLDYSIDWSVWLGTDTIATSAWSVPAGLAFGITASTATTATVWLAGGTAGRTYDVTNTITTAAGRTDQRTIRIAVQER